MPVAASQTRPSKKDGAYSRLLSGDPVATVQEAAGKKLSRSEKDSVKTQRKGEQNAVTPQIVDGLRIEPEVVFQVLDVSLIHPVDSARRADAVVQLDDFGLRLAGWAAPMTILTEDVTVWTAFGKPEELVFGFPFLPSGVSGADHKEVGSMHDAYSSPPEAFVVQLDRDRLIEELEDVWIVLHLVNAGKLDPMAFELDRDAHFPARVAPTDVRAPSANSTSRAR